ncbi:MAG TPA: hypothetical protein DCY89_06390 [Gammaproteobacteria bacterium]|nr:hypothetical protein [Gammaproteobacteria bacterium]
MKGLSPALEAHLASEVTTLVTCWRAARRDGRVYGFTDNAQDLQIDGTTYQAAAGYTPSAVATNASLAIDALEVEGLLDSAQITEADLAGGLWDHAEIEIFQVNYTDLTQGRLWLRRGRLGEVRSTRASFTAELHGMMQALSTTIGEIYSPTCRADLGDARCGVHLAPMTETGTVTGVTSRERFTASGLTVTPGHFAQGRLTWTAGANTTMQMEVKAHSGGDVTLALAMPFAVAVGDTFTVQPGCDKRLATCRDRYSNVIRFRAEPHVPGIDAITRGPR